MASFNLNSRVYVVNPNPNVDFEYGPYTSTAEANLFIATQSRAIGKTVGLMIGGSMVEYWWKSGTASSDLIEKTSASIGATVSSSYVPKYITGYGLTNSTIHYVGDELKLDSNTTISGTATATKYVVTGGTSSQFMKADGSLESGSFNKNYILTGQEVVIPPYMEYFIYGDLQIDGKITNNGKVIIANGSMIMGTSGVYDDNGYTELVDLAIAPKIIAITASAGTTTTVNSIITGANTAFYYDYVVTSTTNARSGTIFAVINGTHSNYTDVGTSDIGNTNDISFSISFIGGSLLLNATTVTNAWNVKTSIRSI